MYNSLDGLVAIAVVAGVTTVLVLIALAIRWFIRSTPSR